MASPKLVAAWITGALLLLLGSWIMTNLKAGPGVTDVQYAFALVLALVLYLAAGLLWISVGVAVREHNNKWI